ncbi:MAG: hypothetical protein WCG47_29465 [Dermatophilaceae bacterium]
MRRVTVVPLVALGLIVLYVFVVRPRTVRWGATDEEVTRPLPGDRVVRGRAYTATRAITIDAPPEEVWPWIVQIGSGRAGWYAIDRLDNGGVPSAQEVMPELQNLQVGDLIPMVPGKDVGPRVLEIDSGRRMLWTTEDEFAWDWVLEPFGQGRTRLISRIRERYPPLLSTRMLYALVASTADIVMIWMQLRGIKRRAERRASLSSSASPTESTSQ